MFSRGDKASVNVDIREKELLASKPVNQESAASTLPVQNLLENKTFKTKFGGIGSLGNQQFKSETVSRKTFSAQDKVILVGSVLDVMFYINAFYECSALFGVLCPCFLI